VPPRQGVVAGVRTATKRCRRCKRLKPLAAFGSDRTKPDGRSIYCRACASAQSRETAARRKAGTLRGRGHPRAGWAAQGEHTFANSGRADLDENRPAVRLSRTQKMLQEIEDRVLADLVSS
jgi:hypothetical protein